MENTKAKTVVITVLVMLLIFCVGIIVWQNFFDKEIKETPVVQENVPQNERKQKEEVKQEEHIEEKKEVEQQVVEEVKKEYEDLNSKSLGTKDVLFITKVDKNNNGTYTLYGVKYKHDDKNKNEAQISDRWILTDEKYEITLNKNTSATMVYDYENKYNTVEDVFKTYKESKAKDISNPSYENCFRFVFKNGKCTKVESVLTGMPK